RSSSTCSWKGWKPPPAPRRYTANARCPLALVGSRRMSPGPAGHCRSTKRLIREAPRTQLRNGGISHTASEVNNSCRAATSLASKASTYRSSSWRCCTERAAGAIPGGEVARRTCVRARCSMLFTAAVETPTASASSLAFQLSTSRRISTARCRGERCCSATMNANRVLSRSSTTAPGSVPGSPSTVSGSGFQPRDFRALHEGIPRIATGAQPGGQRPAIPVLQCAQARSGGDPVQPSAQRRAAFELVEGAPGPQVGLLDRVLGVVHRTQHAVAVDEQLAAEGCGELTELLGDRSGHAGSPSRLLLCACDRC